MWLSSGSCVRVGVCHTRRELLVRDTRRWQGDVMDCRSAGCWKRKRCRGKSHFSQFLPAIGARIPAQIHKYSAMPPSLTNSLFNWKLACTKLLRQGVRDHALTLDLTTAKTKGHEIKLPVHGNYQCRPTTWNAVTSKTKQCEEKSKHILPPIKFSRRTFLCWCHLNTPPPFLSLRDKGETYIGLLFNVQDHAQVPVIWREQGAGLDATIVTSN